MGRPQDATRGQRLGDLVLTAPFATAIEAVTGPSAAAQEAGLEHLAAIAAEQAAGYAAETP